MIRTATADDAPALRAIYAPFVEQTAISFELEPPSVEEMRARIVTTLRRLPWLVSTDDGLIGGYAYAGPHHPRDAYQWSVNVSVYVAPARQRSGVARALYERLFAELAALGYVNAYAGIALPNDASTKLHEALGFEPVGIYRRVGFKLGAWRDVAWLARTLRPHEPNPAPPRIPGEGE